MHSANSRSSRHPQTGQAIRFLPPDSGIGTLVKVAVSEYIRYFNALKQGALPQPQATKEQVAQVAEKMSVYDVLNKSGFREIRQPVRFDYLKNTTLEQLTPEKNTKIYHDLNKSMHPMSKLSVPYDTKYCKREKALINRYQQTKPASLKIDTERAVYKKAEVIYEGNHIRFPFIFEVLAIPIIEASEKWKIISGRLLTRFHSSSGIRNLIRDSCSSFQTVGVAGQSRR